MSSGPVRVGIAGLGMGRAHALACIDSRKVRLTAVADPDVEKREAVLKRVEEQSGAAVAKKLRATKVFDDYRKMVDSGDIDAMIVALPNTMHADSSIYSMKHGVHVLCEKPPTNTTVEMKKVAKVAKQTGCTYMFGRQQRFDAAKDAARKLIERGALGEIYHVESTWMRYNGIPYRQGWGVNKAHGGGVLLDLGVHKLDDAWFLMGCPQPVSAYAAMHCGFAYTAEKMNLQVPYNADDATFGIVHFENGASVLMKVTFALQTAGPGDVDPSTMGAMGWQDINIYGSHGGLDLRHGLFVSQKKGKIATKPLVLSKAKKARGLQGQVEEFARAISTGTEPLNTASQAVALMQMLDALKKSGETGRSISIKPFSA